jgi:hypothetical protein
MNEQMKNEIATATEDSRLDDNQLAAVAGGNLLGEILVDVVGHAVWEGVKAGWEAYYDWCTKADRPPYTRA